MSLYERGTKAKKSIASGGGHSAALQRGVLNTVTAISPPQSTPGRPRADENVATDRRQHISIPAKPTYSPAVADSAIRSQHLAHVLQQSGIAKEERVVQEWLSLLAHLEHSSRARPAPLHDSHRHPQFSYDNTSAAADIYGQPREILADLHRQLSMCDVPIQRPWFTDRSAALQGLREYTARLLQGSQSTSATQAPGTLNGRSILEAQETPKLDTIEDIDDIDALLDPHSYYTDMDRMKNHVVGMLPFQDLFLQTGGEALSRPLVHSGDPAFLDSCVTRIASALSQLQSYKLCGPSITILVEGSLRPGVAEAIDIPIEDIIWLSKVISRCWSEASALSAYLDMVLGALGVLRNPPVTTLDPKYSMQMHLHLLCCILTVGTMAYTGTFTQDLLPGLRECVFTEHVVVPRSFVFQQRRLTCLSKFLKKPVWVFSIGQQSQALDIAISATQFAALWGPVYAVPTDRSFTFLSALYLDGGVLYCNKRSGQGLASDEVAVHFTRTTSSNPAVATSMASGNPILPSTNGEKVPANVMPFPAGARMIIGSPLNGSSFTILSPEAPTNLYPLRFGTSTPVHVPRSSNHMSKDLQENDHCQLDIERFAKEHAGHIRDLGVDEPHYRPDTVSATFSFGKWVNPGFSRTWKRQETTLKRRLLDYCSKPTSETRIWEILDQNYGLELSLCTFNARRTTLWKALQLAHAKDLDRLNKAYAEKDAPLLSAYLNDLEHTGLNRQEQLVVFWARGPGLPQGLAVATKSPPAWRMMLEDSTTSVCFGVASETCLRFHGKDQISGIRITGNTARPVLQTDIRIDNDSRPAIPLQPGAIIRLRSGALEIRSRGNYNGTRQLALFRDNSILNRVSEARICLADRRMGNVHAELYHASKATLYTIPVFIVDITSDEL